VTAAAQQRSRERGNALIEFSLLGIPLLFMTIGIVAISLDMWEFHNLAYATEMTARYVSLHGATCAQSPNACTIRVRDVAAYFSAQALALDPGQVIVTLTDGSGTTTCSPLSTCTATATQFPNAANNSVGSDVTIKASYILKNPIALFWPPDVDVAHDFTVAATSRQRILF
jgi:Flp pilus assembly protein TadG